MIRKNPDNTDLEIAEQAAKDLEIEISRSGVARIRNEKQSTMNERNQPSHKELMEAARLADEVDRQMYDQMQPLLNFSWDKEIKEETEEAAKEGSPVTKKESEKQLIERLEAGERFNFAGELIHNVFLNEVGLKDILTPFPVNAECTYQSVDILNTLFHSINLGIPSIEAMKLINASDFGILLGMNRAPDKETIRSHLTRMAEQSISGDLADRFAHAILNHNFIDPKFFFIDGHFLPYYGLNVIAKGYFTVRRLAMKANELYAITDLQGRPLFFITESNEIDFRPIIRRSAEKMIEYGIKRPILVFDRGGYGIHFFKKFNEIADFVTWAKHVSNKALARIPNEDFKVGIQFKGKKYLVSETIRTVKESVGTANKEGRSEPTSIDLRR